MPEILKKNILGEDTDNLALNFILNPSVPISPQEDLALAQFAHSTGFCIFLCFVPFSSRTYATLLEYTRQKENIYRCVLSAFRKNLPAVYSWFSAVSENHLFVVFTRNDGVFLTKDEAANALRDALKPKAQKGHLRSAQYLWTFALEITGIRRGYTLLKKASVFYDYMRKNAATPTFIEAPIPALNQRELYQKLAMTSLSAADAITAGDEKKAAEITRNIVTDLSATSPCSRTAFLTKIMWYLELLLRDLVRQNGQKTAEGIKTFEAVFGTDNINILHSHMQDIIHTLILNVQSGNMNSAFPQAQKAYQYIVANLADPNLTIKRVAAHCSISPQMLTRQFQKCFRITPRQFIETRRVELLQINLQNGIGSIQEACEKAGIPSKTTAYRILRKNTGKTPGALRSENADN